MEQQQVQQPERVAEPAAEVEANPGIARVRALLGQLEESPRDEALATSFNRAVSVLARQRTREVFEFLRGLAELPVLRQAKDPTGWACRAAVLAAWIDLGYPWALELSPEDHAWMRENAPGYATGWLTVTFVLAAISALLNVGLAGLITFATLSNHLPSLETLLFALPFVAMAAHAIASLAVSQGAQRDPRRGRGWLRVLAHSAWVVVAGAAAVAGFASPEIALAGTVICLPFLLTSASAGVSAYILGKRPP